MYFRYFVSAKKKITRCKLKFQQYSKFPPSASRSHSLPPLPSASLASFDVSAVVDWIVGVRGLGDETEVKTRGDGKGVPRGVRGDSNGGSAVRIWNRCVFCLRIHIL